MVDSFKDMPSTFHVWQGWKPASRMQLGDKLEGDDKRILSRLEQMQFFMLIFGGDEVEIPAHNEGGRLAPENI